MRSLLTLAFLASPLLAADGATTRPLVTPPRTVVPPPPCPAPPALEMPAVERVLPRAAALPGSTAPAIDARRAGPPSPASGLDAQSIELERAGRTYLSRSVQTDTVDGRLWARGRGYKASFGRDGLTFIPFLGSDAPQSYPVTFALDAIETDAGEIELDAQADAVRDGDRITIDRGIVDEVYETTVEGIEQSLVVERRPASGACVLRVAVTSQLEFDASSQGIRFANERGGVEYGQAFALAADGSKGALPTSFVDGHVEIALSDELLATASYPLVVDPIVTTFTIPPGGPFATPQIVNIDVAYDDSTNRALYVTEEVFTATDHDVLATLVDGAGVFQAAHYFDFTSDDWVGPKVATYADYDEFFTVASVRLAAGGVRRIRGVFFRPVAPITWNSPFDVATSTDALINPDVGGDPFPGPSYFCVVWERVRSTTNHDIEYCTVDGVGNLFNVGAVLDNSTGTYDSFPRISKSNMTNFWNVVWQRGAPSGDHDIYGASLNYFGASVLPSHGISIDPLDDDVYPVVTGNLYTGERMVLFWTTNYFIHVFGEFVTGTTPGGLFTISPANPNTSIPPSIDTDGKRIFFTYVNYLTTSSANSECVLSEFQPVDGGWSELRSGVVTTNSATTAQARGTCISSRFAGGGTSGDAVCGGLDNDTTPMGALYSHAPFGPSGNGEFVVPTCFGDGSSGTSCPCSNNGAPGRGCGHSGLAIGAILTGINAATLGNDTFVLNAQDMPNGGTLYFQGTASPGFGAGTVFGDGLLCLAGTIVRLGVKFNAGGNSSYPQVGDPSITTQGGITDQSTRYYQAWYRDAAPGFCTSATYNLTNALRVTWLW